MPSSPAPALRFLLAADLHIGTPLKRFDRVHEQIANLRAMLATATEQQCAAVVIAGDLFWDKLANAQFSLVTQLLMEAFLPYIQQGGTILAISGNHDSPTQFRALQSTITLAAAALGVDDAAARVRFVTDPSVVMLPGGVQAICLPYPIAEHAAYLVPKGTPASQIAAARNQAIVQQVAEDYRSLLGTLDEHHPAITIGHFHVEGAALPGQSGEGFEHAWDRDFQIPKRLLQHPRVSFIGLGHIHERQSLDHDTWYAGSSTILNSAEADSRKGALVVDIPHAGFGRVTPVDLPHTPIKVFRVRASDLETLLGRLTTEEREETYVKFVVTMDGSLTRKSVRTLIGKTARRYFGIEIIEPREVEAAAARLQRPATARLNAHDLGGTLRAHITEQHRDDPDLEALLALAESCLDEAKARGDWSHQGGSQPTGDSVHAEEGLAVEGALTPPTLGLSPSSPAALFDGVTAYSDATDLVTIDLP